MAGIYWVFNYRFTEHPFEILFRFYCIHFEHDRKFCNIHCLPLPTLENSSQGRGEKFLMTNFWVEEAFFYSSGISCRKRGTMNIAKLPDPEQS